MGLRDGPKGWAYGMGLWDGPMGWAYGMGLWDILPQSNNLSLAKGQAYKTTS